MKIKIFGKLTADRDERFQEPRRVAFSVHEVKIHGGRWPDQPMVGRASDAQMFQCLDQRCYTDSAGNLRDHAWSLRHFGDNVRAKTGSVTTT